MPPSLLHRSIEPPHTQVSKLPTVAQRVPPHPHHPFVVVTAFPSYVPYSYTGVPGWGGEGEGWTGQAACLIVVYGGKRGVEAGRTGSLPCVHCESWCALPTNSGVSPTNQSRGAGGARGCAAFRSTIQREGKHLEMNQYRGLGRVFQCQLYPVEPRLEGVLVSLGHTSTDIERSCDLFIDSEPNRDVPAVPQLEQSSFTRVLYGPQQCYFVPRQDFPCLSRELRIRPSRWCPSTVGFSRSSPVLGSYSNFSRLSPSLGPTVSR